MRPGQRARVGRAGAVGAGDGEVIVVRSQQALREMEAYLLSGDRSQPVVGLTRLAELNEPVLAPGGVRAVVGAGPRIYYLPGEYLLRRLEGVLGRGLALPAAGVRVWWPGLCTRSAPGDHPYVLALDSESQSDMLAEFARELDLSRPLVREEITVIEAARVLAEYELSQAREQNRLMQVRLERVLTRAQRAERALQSAESPVGKTGRDAP
jgi:hypothetical protein